MTWNYRVLEAESGSFRIVEAYYVDGKISMYTGGNGIEAYGDTADELREDLNLMLLAFDKPVLNEKALRKELGIS